MAYGRKIIILPFRRDISVISDAERSAGDISLEGLRFLDIYFFSSVPVIYSQFVYCGMYLMQYGFMCKPSDFSMTEDAEFESRIIVELHEH
jgi:hypothetical protein